MSRHSFDEELPGDASLAGVAWLALSAFLATVRVPADRLHAVRLALHEAVDAVAARSHGVSTIRVYAAVEHGQLHVWLGNGDPLDPGQPELLLADALVDELVVDDINGGQVRLTVDL